MFGGTSIVGSISVSNVIVRRSSGAFINVFSQVLWDSPGVPIETSDTVRA